jgi:DNA-binding transcriptional regulator YhcF (GntR family)
MTTTDPHRRYRQYAISTDAEIDADRRQILNRLLTECRGYENRLSASDLATGTDIKPTTVRDVVGELKQEFSIPVANVGSGYWIVETGDELERAVENLRGEIETRQERLETLVANYNQHKYE